MVKRSAADRAKYHAYLASPNWQNKRRLVMERAGNICEFQEQNGWYKDGPIEKRCTKQAVHVHHLTYRHIFDEPLSDLQAVCDFHHKLSHLLESDTDCEVCGDDVFPHMEDAVNHVQFCIDTYDTVELQDIIDNVPDMCDYCESKFDDD
jgi:hypothetical protein